MEVRLPSPRTEAHVLNRYSQAVNTKLTGLQNQINVVQETATNAKKQVQTVVDGQTLPSAVSGFAVTQAPYYQDGALYCQLTATYTAPSPLGTFAGVVIAVANYHGSASPVKVTENVFTGAPGASQSFTFRLDRTGETVEFYCLAMTAGNVTSTDWTSGPSVSLALIAGLSAPSAPTGLTATNEPGGVALVWNANSEANLQGYKAYRNTSNSFGTSSLLMPVASTRSGGPAYFDSTAAPGTTYYYWVTAVNSAGEEGSPSPDATIAATATATLGSNRALAVIDDTNAIVAATKLNNGTDTYNIKGVGDAQQLDVNAETKNVLDYGRHAAPITGVISSGGTITNTTKLDNDAANTVGDSHSRAIAGLDSSGNVARALTSAIKALIALTDLEAASLVLDHLADSNYFRKGVVGQSHENMVVDPDFQAVPTQWYFPGAGGAIVVDTLPDGSSGLVAKSGSGANYSAGVHSPWVFAVPGETYVYSGYYKTGGTGNWLQYWAEAASAGLQGLSAATVWTKFTATKTMPTAPTANAPAAADISIVNTSATADWIEVCQCTIRKVRDLDSEVGDGSTYLRMPGSHMDGNRRGLIDFAQSGHLGKTVDNIGDGTGSPLAGGKAGYLGLTSGGLVALGLPDAIKALIALTDLEAASLVLDHLSDGTYAKPLATALLNGVVQLTGGAGVTGQLPQVNHDPSVVVGSQSSAENVIWDPYFQRGLSGYSSNSSNLTLVSDMLPSGVNGNCAKTVSASFVGSIASNEFSRLHGATYLYTGWAKTGGAGNWILYYAPYGDSWTATIGAPTVWTYFSFSHVWPSGVEPNNEIFGNVTVVNDSATSDWCEVWGLSVVKVRGYGSEVCDDGANGFNRLLHVDTDNTLHASTCLNNQGSIASASSNATVAMYAIGGNIAAWAASTSYSPGDQVATSGGHNWQCSTGGTSGGSAPAAPGAVGDIVTDGTVQWVYLGTGILAVVVTGGSVVFRDGSTGSVPNWSASYALNATWSGALTVNWGGTYYANLAYEVATGAAQLQLLQDNSRTSLADIYGDGLVPIIQGAYTTVGGAGDATGGFPSGSGSYVGL